MQDEKNTLQCIVAPEGKDIAGRKRTSLLGFPNFHSMAQEQKEANIFVESPPESLARLLLQRVEADVFTPRCYIIALKDTMNRKPPYKIYC